MEGLHVPNEAGQPVDPLEAFARERGVLLPGQQMPGQSTVPAEATPAREAQESRLAVLSENAQQVAQAIKDQLQREESDLLLDALVRPEVVAGQIRDLVRKLLLARSNELTIAERDELEAIIVSDLLGIGLLDGPMHDPEVSDIEVVDWQTVYVVRNGQQELSPLKFGSYQDALNLCYRIAGPTRQDLTVAKPILDARLANKARVNIIIQPAAVEGPVIAIRKPPDLVRKLTPEDLVRNGSLSAETLSLFKILGASKANVVVGGWVGTGKTTILRVIGSYFPPDDRVVLIEDTPELGLGGEGHRHVMSFQATARTSMLALVVAALRQMPDRVVIGEARTSQEMAQVRQGWRTGSPGGLLSIHVGSAPWEMIDRLMEGSEQDSEAMRRRQVMRGADVLIFCQRFPDGSRRVAGVWEVRSPEVVEEEGGPEVNPLVLYGRTEDGEPGHQVVGQLSRALADRLEIQRGPNAVQEGIHVPEAFWPDGWRPNTPEDFF